ncbi:Hsp70 family protein [Planctomyces sp. SH-PL14]|uniref:Hsp70 family protein n=1 Tax=Planctomyces sp. SH-PL14 TaxID=1632864 RepID=UPI00078D324D|nr:Hsp70 family protein [Planctomyces sp. SH-PL14]AMV20567.1 Chaperone protein DnaK [Planctomyces sp. SH-PL14]
MSPPLPDPGPTPALIGIDLGTTHSLAAVMTAHGPALIRNALGEVLTPSIIGFDEQDRLHVGRTAQELQVTRPDRCAAVFKRHMGTDRTLKLAGKTLTPVELSSLVLRSLKQDAEAFLGTPVERAVITVPAYFNDNQRNATIEAARLIGLDVARILNEPTAAAIAYGLHESGDDKTVLVVDLGGGTFDVSVVQFFEGTLEIRASSGETFLGGEDITGVLATRVLQQRGIALERAEMESPLLVSRLRRECEIAKRQLSRQSTYVIAVPGKTGEIGDGAPQVTVTRAPGRRTFPMEASHRPNRSPRLRPARSSRRRVDRNPMWVTPPGGRGRWRRVETGRRHGGSWVASTGGHPRSPTGSTGSRSCGRSWPTPIPLRPLPARTGLTRSR